MGVSFRWVGGFSLLELLVVISIIAILSALLLSAVSSSKSRMESMRCQSNLRQWGVALISHVSDEGSYPASTLVEIESSKVEEWHVVLEPHLGAKWPHSQGKKGEWRGVDPRQSVASCPAYARMGGFSRPGLGSYGYNAHGTQNAYSGNELGLGGISSPGSIPTLTTLRLVSEADVVAPSQMIAIGDALLTTGRRKEHYPEWEFSGSTVLTPVSWAAPILIGQSAPFDVEDRFRIGVEKMKLRHRGRWNLVFVDGHTGSLSFQSVFNIRDAAVAQRWNRDNEAHLDQLVVPND